MKIPSIFICLGICFPAQSFAFFHIIDNAYASQDVSVFGEATSSSMWQPLENVGSGDAPVRPPSFNNPVQVTSVSSDNHVPPESEPSLFISSDENLSVESESSESSEEITSSPQTNDNLITDPIDVSRPKGNALLLTSQEVQKALNRIVQTRPQLDEYAKALVQSDKRIQRIEIGESGMHMVYAQRAKLLGFIPLSYSLDTTVDSRGVLHVTKPWWLFLATDNAGEVEKLLHTRIIGEKLVLGNLLRIQDENERSRAMMEMLASIMRGAFEIHSLIVEK